MEEGSLPRLALGKERGHNSVVWPSKTPFLIVQFAGS